MLTLICGPDRVANSDTLLERIRTQAESGRRGMILIVPEQYSHETERLLCQACGDTISRSAEVLSFTRLASRVFSIYGGVCGEYLDGSGRLLTLYLAAQQVREQLKFYASATLFVIVHPIQFVSYILSCKCTVLFCMIQSYCTNSFCN